MVLGREVNQGSINSALVYRHSPCCKTTLKMMLLFGKDIKTKLFPVKSFLFQCWSTGLCLYYLVLYIYCNGIASLIFAL